jgi:hypothetical protein
MGFWGFGEQYVTVRRTSFVQLRIAPKPQNPDPLEREYMKFLI